MKKVIKKIIRTLKLGNIIKYFRWALRIYNYFVYLLLMIIRLFIVPNNKLVLFVSYNGQKFDDSPKAIFNYMQAHPNFKGYKFVWAFREPEKFTVENADKIRVDSISFYIIALKARYLISNAVVGRGVYFKGRNTIYLNTWHGTPMKKIGDDFMVNKNNFRPQGKDFVDIMVAQGEYDAKILSQAFKIPKKNILISGLPRNDELYNNYTIEKVENIKSKLNIPDGKKVILYAPTFRQYEIDNQMNYTIDPPVNFKKWNEYLGKDYIVLFRAHYFVSKVLTKNLDSNFVLNMSDYPSINDLMIVSDILISDYSSLFFDYSIMEKPMLSYAYDLEIYKEKAGLYFDPATELPNGIIKNEEELLKRIKNLSFEKERGKTAKFREKYINSFGDSTKTVVHYLLETGKKNKKKKYQDF